VNWPDVVQIGSDNGGVEYAVVGWVVVGTQLEPVLDRDGELHTMSELVAEYAEGRPDQTWVQVWQDGLPLAYHSAEYPSWGVSRRIS
jgi:hypothetical protein